MTSNPIDMKFVDRKYLLTQIAKSLEIDTTKAVPDEMPETPQGEGPSIVDQAKAGLLQIQTEKEKKLIEKVIADTANVNINSQFSATQAASQLAMNPGVIQTADSLLLSAGYIDKDGFPIAPHEQVPPPVAVNDMPQQNTHPTFPANPQEQEPEMPDLQQPPEMSVKSPDQGIETFANDMPGLVP
jgi:hypothetical protein